MSNLKPCHNCNAPGASFGYGFPGVRKDLPVKKRGYIWACSKPGCREAAEARRAKAIDAGLTPKDGPAPRQAPKRDQRQGSLL